MELDLIDVHFDLKHITPREIEEAMEDPFAVRLLPDSDRAEAETRFFSIGRTVGDRLLFTCFSTDGKKVRIVAAREASEGEQRFYERKYAEFK
jgi:uncharacterized DUF497 family protein